VTPCIYNKRVKRVSMRVDHESVPTHSRGSPAHDEHRARVCPRCRNGEDVFKKCRTCHQVGDAAKNSVGPILNGIVGRAAGTIEGFTYSPANKEARSKGLVWSEGNLLKYLENPAAFMPKTKMIFPGVKDEQDRKDLIAYLKKFPK